MAMKYVHAEKVLPPALVKRVREYCTGLVYFAADPAGGYVAGASAPVVFLSRADDAATRVNSIALGVLMTGAAGRGG